MSGDEMEKLKLDAGRYRFLRGLFATKEGMFAAQAIFWNCFPGRKRLDKRIDALRAACATEKAT